MDKEIKEKFQQLAEYFELDNHAGNLTKNIAVQMYQELPQITSITFAGLFEDMYGYSGAMCEIVESWVK